MNLHINESGLTEALKNQSVLIVCGFCIGFISLIIVDLGFDAIMGINELWLSRSSYFWLSLVYSILIISSESIDQVGEKYILYGSAALIFFTGRAFVDLCLNDSSHTWTMRKSVVLLSMLATSRLFANFALETDSVYSSSLEYIGVAIAVVYTVLLIANSYVSLSLIFNK